MTFGNCRRCGSKNISHNNPNGEIFSIKGFTYCSDCGYYQKDLEK